MPISVSGDDVTDWLLEVWDLIRGPLFDLLLNLFVALIIFKIGNWVISKITHIVSAVLDRQKQLDRTLSAFLVSGLRIGLRFVLLTIILSTIGIQSSTLVAIGAAAVFALAFSLQGSMASFAAGIMLLTVRPFEVGDLVEINDVVGFVKSVSIFHTIIIHEGRTIIVPNAKITDSNVINYCRCGYLRVEFKFGIAYEDDMALARDTIHAVLREDPRVLSEPPPGIFVSGHLDSAVEITAAVYVEPVHFFDIQLTFWETVKRGFEDRGISIPFPQRDVHIDVEGGQALTQLANVGRTLSTSPSGQSKQVPTVAAEPEEQEQPDLEQPPQAKDDVPVYVSKPPLQDDSQNASSHVFDTQAPRGEREYIPSERLSNLPLMRHASGLPSFAFYSYVDRLTNSAIRREVAAKARDSRAAGLPDNLTIEPLAPPPESGDEADASEEERRDGSGSSSSSSDEGASDSDISDGVDGFTETMHGDNELVDDGKKKKSKKKRKTSKTKKSRVSMAHRLSQLVPFAHKHGKRRKGAKRRDRMYEERRKEKRLQRRRRRLLNKYLAAQVEHRKRLVMGETPPNTDGEDDYFVENHNLPVRRRRKRKHKHGKRHKHSAAAASETYDSSITFESSMMPTPASAGDVELTTPPSMPNSSDKEE